jgi:HK97 family phage portal protein
MNFGSTITVDTGGVSEEQAAVLKDYSSADWIGDSRIVASPEELTSLNVIKHGTVWAAVNVIAGDMSQVPFNVMHNTTRNGWVKDLAHPVSALLNYRPNVWQTPSVWKKWVISTTLIWGNAIVWIRRNQRGGIADLVPIPPQHVSYDTDDDGVPYYRITTPSVALPPTLELHEVLHFRGLTGNGFWGYRLAEIAADELSFGRSVVKHAANVFRNGAVPGGVLEHPGKLPIEARRNMREEWERMHRGPQQAGRIAILYEDTKYRAMTVSNVDAQLIEAMADDAVLTARLFRLPPYKLADFRQSSVRANLVQSQTEYWQGTLSDWANMMREELSLKLFPNPATYCVKPDPTELVKGDTREQVEVAQLGVSSMLWTRNEGRVYIGMNPVEGGDKFENPNTTAPNKPAAPAAMLAECKVAVRAEHAKLAKAAETSRNFVAYAERFYASAWSDLVVDVVSAGTVEAANKYADHSRAAVMALADKAKTGKELAELIRQRDALADAALLSSIIMEAAA